MNDSVFKLFLFVTRNHYVILLLHSCTNIVEEFLDNEENIHKRILQNSPRKKRSTEPTPEKGWKDGSN